MRLGNWLLFALLGVILIQACCIAQVSCATANANWQYRYDISHSGYTTDNGTTNSARFLWCYGTGAPVQCSPGVADGIVVVGSRDGHIYGFDSASGTLKWCYIAGNLIEFSSPSIIDGRVYIGCINASIICLDLYTGMPYWTSYVEDVVRSSPLIVDGHVYVGSADCNLYCLDASNGTIIWKYKTNGGIDCSPAYADGIVYFGSIDYHTYAVNASSGEEIWKVFTVHGLCSPAVQNGRVYLGCNNGSVLCLNAYTGAGIWQFHTSDWVVSSPALAYGCVYIGSEDNNVYCLNATDGKKIWQTATEYWVWSSPTVCEGNVYVGSDDYCIYCLDVYTGEIKWNWETNGAIHSSPAILNNTLYIGSDDYSLYAFQLCNAPAENPAPRVYSHRTNATLIFDLISLAVFTVILAFFVRFLWSKRKNQTRPAVTLENKKVPWYIAHFDLLVILAILGFSSLYFISLDYMPLWAADEQTYTQYAYHMLKTGDYITPWSFGAQSVWIGKPPLQMWLVLFPSRSLE
jgi:outer membrane protein assembly factor BamB